MEEKALFYPKSLAQWRQWLELHHASESSVWLVCNVKKSGLPVLAWSDLVDVALCYGWIDSTRKTIDDTRYRQLFSKRRPTSTWSKMNKAKVQRLLDQGAMKQPGLQAIETAKQNGSWVILDDVEALIIPDDLEAAFLKHPDAKAYFLSLSKSVRKMMLQWVTLAKRPETRKKRVNEIAVCSGNQQKPKQF